jgi:hypothetical protein
VWTAIRDFHDMAWAPNVIAKVDRALKAANDDRTGL